MEGSSTAARGSGSARDAAAAVAESSFWYHTIEVAPGVNTPGWFDLRPIVDRMPWPDVRGKRCLDVGTADGFLAFELERRGAAEVVATDVSDHELWDHPPRNRAEGVAFFRAIAGPRKGVGFKIAKEVLASSVELRELGIYDLSPEEVGEFDVVVCGSLLLHLRDPFAGLEAVRSVCRGQFMCTNQVELRPTVLHPRTALARIEGVERGQWWLPNRAGNRQLLVAAGFDVERESELYAIPFGASHPPPEPRLFDWRGHATSIARRVLTGGTGVPHQAILARPAI